MFANDTQSDLRYVGNAVSGQSTNNQAPEDNINLVAADMSYAVMIPITGKLEHVYIESTVTALENFTHTARLKARLYTAPAGTLNFAYVPGSELTMSPEISGIVPAGTIFNGDVALDYDVTAGSKLLAVIWLTRDEAGEDQSLSTVTFLATVIR